VEYPNPEEGKGALRLAMRAADAAGSTLILANDPDADRCAVAEKNTNSGEWRVFTGDEIGIVLAAWVWDRTQTLPDFSSRKKEDHVMITTVVSSRMLRRIAQVEGFTYIETLTGFKYLGTSAETAVRNGKHFLFAYEDAIGYLPGPMSYDKDGIRTAAMLGEMASYLHAQDPPTTIAAYLASLYEKYGAFGTENRYFFCYDPDVMRTIFDSFRVANNGTFPRTLGQFKIKHIRDLTIGYDDEQPNGRPILPVSSSTQMITLTFEETMIDGTVYTGVATIRGSGTEPKLKYYVEAATDIQGGRAPAAFADAKHAAKLMAGAVIEHILRPSQYGLAPPAD